MDAVLALGCAQTAIRLGLSSLTLAALLALALPAWLLFICCSRSLHTPHKQSNPRQIFLGRPRLLPTQVSHTRLGTGRYNYTVPHFLVGTPVGLQGHVGRVLSVDEPESRTQTAGLMQYLSPNLASWFTVHAHHHLDKGNDARGLQGKLHDFLVSQGLSPSEWPYAYLITMPQFLGYQRNLVCIWYLYSASRELSAMIMEVNNYWGQRKIAFSRLTGETALSAPTSSASSAPSAPSTPSSAETHPFYHSNPRHASYRGTWDKDMFISPFEKVEGTIALRFSDPLGPNSPLHITITLLSPSGKPRLIGRVFCPDDGDHDPIDPLAASYWSILRFLPYWTGVLVVTELLIIYAALRIRAKGAPMFSMPEVRPNNHPRDETDIERLVYIHIRTNKPNISSNLEPAFRAYLKHLVESSQSPLTLNYIPSKSHVLEPETFSSSPKEANEPTLTIQVLTPSFYTSFPLYTNPLVAFATESKTSPVPSDPSSRRLYISHPELFFNLSYLNITHCESPVKQTDTPSFNLKTKLCHSLIPRLRENLNLNPSPHNSTEENKENEEEEGKGYFLDTFILAPPNTATINTTKSLQESYITALCAHLLATKYAFGLHQLWTFYGAVGWFVVFQVGLSVFFFRVLQGCSGVGVVGDAVLAMGCHWAGLAAWRGVWE